jgi:hypothetical protein
VTLDGSKNSESVLHTALQAIKVHTFARVYSAVRLQKHCEHYLKKTLPAEKRAMYNAKLLEHYWNEPSLAGLVLETKIPALIPWALYSLVVQLAASVDVSGGPCRALPGVLHQPQGVQMFQLFAVRHIIQHTFTRWYEEIQTFYGSDCPHAHGRGRCCSRRTQGITYFTSPLFVSVPGMMGDP